MAWVETEHPKKLDIWVQQSEFDIYEGFIKDRRKAERVLWFGSLQGFPEPEVTLEDKLNMTSALYGNKVERTVTIINGGTAIKSYKRIKSEK